MAWIRLRQILKTHRFCIDLKKCCQYSRTPVERPPSPTTIPLISAGSIPDSYNIYRYLNLVRYSIFDTRYFRRKCNFVDIFRSYLKRLRHVHLLFFKKLFCYETLRGKRNPDFSLENPIFFPKTYKIRGGCPLLYTTFRKHRNPVFGHFPSFPASSFMPRA